MECNYTECDFHGRNDDGKECYKIYNLQLNDYCR